MAEHTETSWETEWQANYRRQRWIERDGHFYPKGTPLTVIELDVAARSARRLASVRRVQLANRARRLLEHAPPAPAALPGAA